MSKAKSIKINGRIYFILPFAFVETLASRVYSMAGTKMKETLSKNAYAILNFSRSNGCPKDSLYITPQLLAFLKQSIDNPSTLDEQELPF